MNQLSLSSVRGSAIESSLKQLGSLRITVFREYPSLYDGTMAYEEAYLTPLIQSPDSLWCTTGSIRAGEDNTPPNYCLLCTANCW